MREAAFQPAGGDAPPRSRCAKRVRRGGCQPRSSGGPLRIGRVARRRVRRDDRREQRLKLREVREHDPPDLVGLNLAVLVCDDVARGDDRVPANRRVPSAKVFRNVTRGFADD